MQSTTTDRIDAVETSFGIIEALRDLNGAGVTELAGHEGKTKSTVYRHLNTLYENGYVIREDDEYMLSHKFLGFGSYVQGQKDIYPIIEDKVAELSEETNERVQFIVADHGKGIYLFKKNGKHAVNIDNDVGSNVYMHIASAGKAILAHLPEERRKRILDEHGLPELTQNTITDREELIQELAAIREREYALNLEEYTTGLTSVGVPIFDEDDEPLGGLSIAGPSHRMKGSHLKEELPDLLLGAANEIELKQKYEDT